MEKPSTSAEEVPYQEKILQIYTELRETNELPSTKDVKTKKDRQKSRSAEKDGRAEFDEKNYTAAMEHFNRALCFAVPGSAEMGYAYAGRAAIYLDTGFFEFSIENVNLARANGYPRDQKKLLETLETECNKCKEAGTLDAMKIHEMPPELPLKYTASALNPNVIEDLEFVEDDPTYGRCLRSKIKLLAGDVFLKEKPFAQVLYKADVYKYCFHCGSHNFFNLRPSRLSTLAMFCSKACAKEAYKSYYDIECKMLDGLFKCLDQDDTLLSVRILLKALAMVKYDIAELQNIIDTSVPEHANPLKINWMARTNEKEKFRSMYRLETHMKYLKDDEKLENDMLRKCALAWHLLHEYSGMKDELEKHKKLIVELLLHFARIVCVNSYEMCNNCLLGANIKSNEPLQNPVNYGLALAVTFSYLNHSCLPNTWSTTYGAYFAAFAIQPNTPLAISYLTGEILSYPAPIRKKHLKRLYHFECQCPICSVDFRHARDRYTDIEYYEINSSVCDIERDISELHKHRGDKREIAKFILGKVLVALQNLDCNKASSKVLNYLEYQKLCMDCLNCSLTLEHIFTPQNRDREILEVAMRVD